MSEKWSFRAYSPKRASKTQDSTLYGYLAKWVCDIIASNLELLNCFTHLTNLCYLWLTKLQDLYGSWERFH